MLCTAAEPDHLLRGLLHDDSTHTHSSFSCVAHRPSGTSTASFGKSGSAAIVDGLRAVISELAHCQSHRDMWLAEVSGNNLGVALKSLSETLILVRLL